jgi:hypothetical protein
MDSRHLSTATVKLPTWSVRPLEPRAAPGGRSRLGLAGFRGSLPEPLLRYDSAIMARRRARRVNILLPDEAEQRRRSFLVKGLCGGVLLALGGGAWFYRRKTRVEPGATGPFAVFSLDEASVLLAVADRLVPEREGFPRPRALSLARRMDAIAAGADPETRLELRRLVRLFESALTGFLLDGQSDVFTASSPEAQDRRLRAWAESRIAVRRTGFQALKRLVYAAYYGARDCWVAVGYPGPPSRASLREPPARVAPERARAASTPSKAAGPDGRATAPSQPARPDHLAQPPRRRRVFKPLKPFTEQPLEPAPTLMPPRGNDG